MSQIPIAQVPNLYMKLSYALLVADRVTNLKLKKVTDFSQSDVLLYCHMQARYSHFQASGKRLFESQDTLANVLGMERKAVMRSIKRMVLVGMITQKTSYESGVKRSYYTVVDVENNEDFLFSRVVRERFEVEGVEGRKDVVQEKSSEDYVIVPHGYINKSAKKGVVQQPVKAEAQQSPVWDDIEAPF